MPNLPWILWRFPNLPWWASSGGCLSGRPPLAVRRASGVPSCCVRASRSVVSGHCPAAVATL